MADLGLVQKTVAVMACVAAHPGGIGLSDVARSSGLPKATCFRILTTLEAERWLESDPDTKRFRVALPFVLLARQNATVDTIPRFIATALTSLAATVRETAGLDQLVGDSVAVIAEAQGPYLIGHGPRPVPRLLPAWRTSTGKALLAFTDELPDPATVDADLAARPMPTMRDHRDLVAELERVRERGYATAYNELEEGLAAVAVPVRVGGRVPYAVWVGGPTFRMPLESLPGHAETLMATADDIAGLLDGFADELPPLPPIGLIPSTYATSAEVGAQSGPLV